MTCTSTKLVAGLLAACLCSSVAGADTTGTTVGGYTFGSDIQGYLDISQDVCDLMAAVNAGDFASARAIYTNGQNSVRSDGSTRKLQEWAISGSDGEPHWSLYSSFFANDSDWVDTFVRAGFDGAAPWTSADAQAQVVKKGVQSNLLVAYMFHEVDEAAEAVEEGQTDAKTGAPHKVDEGAAIWFGTTCPAGSIADVANKRAASFGTLTAGPDGVCTAATNVAAGQALSALQDAALKGGAAAYATATKALEKAVVTVWTQATLTYAQELEEQVAAGSSTDEAKAEGIAFFRTIQPLVAQVSPLSADTIAVALASPAKGVAAKVTTAFEPVLTAYGITPAELGSLGATSQCTLDAASPPTGGAAGLPAGSTLAGALAAAAGAIALLA
ncbi:hypothetical protein ABPG77_004984 [Micractinium sp. CCAP 211/92]